MLVTCHGRKFEVYEKQDAINKKVDFRADWRNADIGDWILTSDDKVLKVRDRKVWTGNRVKPLIFIRTGYGDTTITKKHIYAYKTKNYAKDRRKDASYNPVKNTRPTTLQKIFLDYLTKVGEPTNYKGKILWDSESIITAYKMAYSDNNENQALQRGYSILKKKFAKEYMSKLMREQFDDIGIDDEYVALKYRQFVEDGDVPHSVRLNALNKVSDLRGHNDKQHQEETQTVLMLHKSEDDRKMLAEAKKLFSSRQGSMLIKEAEENVKARNSKK